MNIIQRIETAIFNYKTRMILDPDFLILQSKKQK